MSRAPFVLLQLANISGATANAMAFIAIPWLVLELTGSAASTGVVAAVAAVPAILMSPLAGLLIDRVGRARIAVLSDIFSGVSVLLIPFVALVGRLDLWVIAGAALLGALFDPAGYTARKTLIEPTAKASGVGLNRANSLHEALFALGFGLGPAIGAFLIGAVGTTTSFAVMGIFFGLAAVSVMLIPRASTLVTDDAVDDPDTWWRDAIAGFRVIRKDKALLTVTAFVVFLDFFYMPTEVVILPTYFESQGNPWGMGIVISAMAIGGVIGSYSYAPLAARFSMRAIVLGCSIASTILMFGLAFFPPVWVMALSGFALGASWGPMGPLLNTMVQTRCKPSVQGRVFGAQMSLFASGPPLGMVLVGGLVEGLGVFLVYPMIVAILCIVAVAMVWIRQLKDMDHPHTLHSAP